MRRADRLFDIIQHLRRASTPVRAADLAAALEVGIRTIYRDIAALQASRVPIEGASGLGYVLRCGYDLPPLMFDAEELEAIAVGARLLRRTGDLGLEAAAERVLGKLQAVLPEAARDYLACPAVHVGEAWTMPCSDARLGLLRLAAREGFKLELVYRDGQDRVTRRKVRPVGLGYFDDAVLLCAWCELREDHRLFRVERIQEAIRLEERFDTGDPRLLSAWRLRFSAPIDAGSMSGDEPSDPRRAPASSP